MEKDFEIKNEKLYTVREAAEICNVSRATLLRMEEAGFDSPRLVNEANGYRYYDVVNIHRIKLYQMLQMIGLSNKEIYSYINNDLDTESFLSVLHERLAIAQRCVEEFETRLIDRGEIRFENVDLPEVTCACFVTPNAQPKEQIEYNYKEIQRLYDMGFKPAAAVPMFSVTPGIERVFDGESSDEPVTICVAIDPQYIPDPQIVKRFTQRKAYSIIYKGNEDEIMSCGGRMLLDEMKKMGIKPTGPCYGICLLGPYFGTQIDPDDYVFRWAIPID